MLNGTCSRAALTASFLLTFLFVFVYSWVAEDAYITFRVVDHFIQGYGLRWNIDERVQVYTHPLWMMLHIPLYFIFDNIFWISIFIGAACTIAAMMALLQNTPSGHWHKIVLLLLPLTLSISFRHYMISGLEVPLTCLLLALFFNNLQRRRLYASLFIASLCILNRFDNILLISPALLWLFFTQRKTLNLPKAFAAFLPFCIWCVFCLVYYGFIFPNSKYAKLNTGIDPLDYLQQGFHYIENFLYFDTIGFIAIVLAMYTAISAIWRRHVEVALPGLGIALYVAYILTVGGDFMAGRLLVPLFFLSLLTLHRTCAHITTKQLRTIFFLIVIVFFVGRSELSLLYPNSDNFRYNYGIVAEHDVYANTNALFTFHPFSIRSETTHDWKNKGKAAISAANDGVITAYCVGMYGFYASPNIILVDNTALTDPLLARIPIKDPKLWRIGHFYRKIPPGYVHARQTGDSSQMEEPLRHYYDQLRLVISGDLFTKERWKAILQFHTNAIAYK